MTEVENEVVEETAEGNGGEGTLPKDIFSDEMPSEEHVPLSEQTRPQAHAFIPSESEEVKSDPSGGRSSKFGEESAAASDTAAAATPPALSPEERSTQAALTVTMFFKAYEKLHAVGRHFSKVSDTEMLSLNAQDKIDLSVKLPITGEPTIGEFFGDFNKGVDENIVVSDEFKNDFRPPAERVCLKNGWLLNDELSLAIMLGEDISVKIGLFVAYKKSINEVLKALIKEHEDKKAPKAKPETSQEQDHPKQEETITTKTSDWAKEE